MAKKTKIKPNRKECKGPGYYRDYEAKRRGSGKGARVKFKAVRREVRKFVRRNPEYRDLESYLVMAVLKKWYNLSYRGMVDELNCNKLLRKRLGFKRTPPKSTMWWHVYRLPIGLLDELVAFTAGTAAMATLVADSSSYTYDRYGWVETAKGGRRERLTVKHHVLLAMDGCVAASAVTDGDRDDSPILLKMTGTVPTGSGYLPADAKYCKENCREALRIGRLPCIRPPKNHTGHGLDAWACMVKWERGKPGSFYKKYGMRNLVESGFSSLKDRFRDHIRSVTPRMQVRELALMSICHNHTH